MRSLLCDCPLCDVRQTDPVLQTVSDWCIVWHIYMCLFHLWHMGNLFYCYLQCVVGNTFYIIIYCKCV